MKNIWILNHYASKEGRHTFFARELVERGYNVTLFASSFVHNNFKETKVYPPNSFSLYEETEKGYSRVWIKTPSYKGNNYKRLLNQLCFAIRGYIATKKLNLSKPDVIVGSSVHPFTGLTAFKLSKTYGVPFIFEVRDLWPQTLVDLGAIKEKSFVTFIFKLLEKFLYKRAIKIITVMPLGVDYIASLGIEAKKVFHISNGIDLNWFDNKKSINSLNDNLDNYFSINYDKLIIVYVGAMGLANGLDTLIKAISIIQKESLIKPNLISFLMVGDGSERNRLMKMVAEQGLGNVFFSGYVNRDMVPYTLSKSDIAISIVKKSRIHRYGVSMNKIFDYLASGKPIISAVGAPCDFAEVADCGFSVKPDDPAGLAMAIVEMAKLSHDQRNILGNRGRKYVEINHDYKILTDQLLELFHDIT